jgi:hypothetical protein
MIIKFDNTFSASRLSHYPVVRYVFAAVAALWTPDSLSKRLLSPNVLRITYSCDTWSHNNHLEQLSIILLKPPSLYMAMFKYPSNVVTTDAAAAVIATVAMFA